MSPPQAARTVEAGSAQAVEAGRHVSYWSVVGAQLRKNGAAMAALRVVLALLLVAVGSPMLASNVPLAWRDRAGLSFPLAETLFDRFLYPGGVDVFFNLALVVTPFWGLASLWRRPRSGGSAWAWAWGRFGWPPALTLLGAAAAALAPSLGLPEGAGAAGWAALLGSLPWTGRGAMLVCGALFCVMGPATVGVLLAVLAAPVATALALLLLYGAAIACGASTLGWVVLWVAVPGTVLVLLSRRGTLGPPPHGWRRAAGLCALVFVVGFLAIQTEFQQTRSVVDWHGRVEASREAERAARRAEDAVAGHAGRDVPAALLAARDEAARALDAKEAWGLFAPTPFHPDNTGEQGSASIDRSLRKPGGVNFLGCDLNGRDVAARMIFGTRISMTIGLVAVTLFVAIGVFLGSLAGYYGGKVDILIQRLIEIMICFPSFFLLLTIIAVFDTRSIFMIMATIGIIGWPGVARLVRAEFLRQRGLDYVVAATAQGIPQRRIIFGHVLPNCMGPVLVSATLGVAASILMESGLAFLGLGDANTASWGQMLTSGRDTLMWHLILVPGFAIFLVVTVFNLLGEGLRDALDPRLRR